MRKIVGILLVTLLIVATALPVVGITNVKETLKVVEPAQLLVLDQAQEHSDECAWLSYGVSEWQEFLNRGNQIMSVELYMYNSAPHEDGYVRLSIEKPLGTILTKKELSCDDIAPGYADIWFSFDVDPDVKLGKGQKYYIVLYYEGPCELCWHGCHDDLYPDGDSSKGGGWDYCFRTYVDKSKSMNTPLFSFFQQYPILYQLFQRVLRL